MPRVSVIVPAYNAAAFIRRAIDSVLAQSWQDFELLVVDDGSRDTTLRVLAEYGSRVQVLRQTNAGPASARNLGLRAAKGEFVAFLDADDWWESGKLAAQVALLDSRSEIGFCSTSTRVVDATGATVNQWSCCGERLGPWPDVLFMNTALISGSTSAVMAHRRLVFDVGAFDPALRGFEDPDLWIRLSARARYACIPEPLTVVVRTPNSVSSALATMRRAALCSFRKNRELLPAPRRGAYWRSACAGLLTDLAKAAWRSGDRRLAVAWTIEAFFRAPVGRGKLALSLMLAMALDDKL